MALAVFFSLGNCSQTVCLNDQSRRENPCGEEAERKLINLRPKHDKKKKKKQKGDDGTRQTELMAQ